MPGTIQLIRVNGETKYAACGKNYDFLSLAVARVMELGFTPHITFNDGREQHEEAA